MRKGKTLLLFTLLLFLGLAYGTQGAQWPRELVIVNNGLVQLKYPLINEKGRMLVYIGDLLDRLKLTCQISGEDTIVIEDEEIKVELKINDPTAFLYGKDDSLQKETVELEAPARKKGDIIYVPLRFLAEAFGSSVNWDRASRSISITTVQKTVPEGTSVEYSILDLKNIQADERLASLYRRHQMEGIHSLELNGNTYVIFSAGMKPTGGYRIKIEEAIKTDENSLYLVAQLLKPGPNDLVTMALTYPHIVLEFKGQVFEQIDGHLME